MSPSDQSPLDGSDGDIIPDRSEALEFEPIVRTRPKRRVGVTLSLLVLIGGSAGAGWYYYGDTLMAGANNQIPVIRAVDGPVKVRPENPGGMAIPDRDKLVYERLKNGGADPRVERLLPPSETPIAPPEPKSGPTNLAETSSVNKATPEIQQKQIAAPIINPATIPKMAKPTRKITPPLPEVPIVKTAPPAAVVSSPSKAYRVQLAAVRSEAVAGSEWDRLRKKNTDLLGNLTLDVVRVDLGTGKGVFYRLRAGPLKNEVDARKLCEKLSSRKIGCLIVRPGG